MVMPDKQQHLLWWSAWMMLALRQEGHPACKKYCYSNPKKSTFGVKLILE